MKSEIDVNSECSHLHGRLREICEGRVDLPLLKINIYRDKWGLPPLTALPAGRRASVPVVTESRVPSTSPPSTSCCGGGRKKKSLISRALKLAEATARHLADDSKPTPEDALKLRESACESCPLRDENECRSCGCVLYPNVLNNGKLRWRSEACPAGKWSRQRDTYQPLVNPTRNLIFHVYPLLGAEWNWHWHIDQIRRVAPLFNGKIVIATVTGPALASTEEVQQRFEGIPVTDWLIRPNSKLGETVTFADQLAVVETDDPNTITFRGHTKGVTHKPNGPEQPWARLMWSTLMDLPSVDDALASHVMVGSMKCHEPLVARPNWSFFYAGTFFWFRNKEIFQRNWRQTEPHRWWPEAWPGVVCQNDEAACLCHDYTKGSVLDNPYWHAEVAADFQLWKDARPNRRLDLE